MAVLKSIEKEIAHKQSQIQKFANEERTTIIDLEKATVQLRQITELMDEYTVSIKALIIISGFFLLRKL